MRYYNPKNKKTPKRDGSHRYTKKHYNKLDIPERKSGSYKKKKFFTSPKAIGIAALSIIITIVSMIVIPARTSAQYSVGYEVFLCGKPIGIVDSSEEVDLYLSDVRTQFAEAWDMKVTDQLEIEYRQVATNAKHICPADVFTNMIASSIDVKVLGTIIYVNDWAAAVVGTPEEAQWVLEQAKSPYEAPSNGLVYSDISFVEDVRTEEGAADFKDIVDKETALHNLTIGPGVELKYHIVVTGDALKRIARKEGVKVSDIRIANPQLSDTDKIFPGDKLLVVAPKNSLSIRYTEIIDREQDVPFETEYSYDDTAYTTQTEVLKEGVVGRSHVRAKIKYINGIEVDYNLIEQTPLVAPETRIVRKGTIPVPKELTLAEEGRMTLPLRKGTYSRISCPFGPREAPVPGASTFHKGIDMAADVGTPIYASADGTVRYAGSEPGFGRYIKLSHGGGVQTLYGHCSQLLVKKGQKVKAGEIIALVGNTGRSSGSHLHFEIRIDGVAVDPLKGK